jgi:hypothetical protein
MPSITLKDNDENEPIGYIKGGKYNGELVYIDAKNDKVDLPLELDDINFNKLFTGKAREKQTKIEQLQQSLHKKLEPLDDEVRVVYNNIVSGVKKELLVNDGIFQPIPNPDKRECILCSGASGSGKSTFIYNYCKEFIKLFPSNCIYLFSKLVEDEVLDRLKPKLKRVMIDQTLIDEPVDIHNDFSNGDMIIFDDINTIKDKKLLKAIEDIRDDVLETGRLVRNGDASKLKHNRGFYCMMTNHILADGVKTKLPILESNKLVIFPHSGGQVDYFLKTYGGLDAKQIKKVKMLPSRWCMIKKNYPLAIAHEHGLFLVN